MGAGKKRIKILMKKLKILEIIYIQQKFEWEYWDKLEELKKRLEKLPLLAEKNPNYFEIELNWCLKEAEDILSIVHPNCFKDIGLPGDIDDF
jgi:hypothetical protein